MSIFDKECGGKHLEWLWFGSPSNSSHQFVQPHDAQYPVGNELNKSKKAFMHVGKYFDGWA